MSALDAKVSAYLDQFYALEARCEGRENLHTLSNEAERIFESVASLLSTMPDSKKSEQKLVVERKLMSATRKGDAPWRHVANFALGRFQLLSSDI